MKANNRIMEKKIIVTGASSGIGEKIAKEIASLGGTPILLARSHDKLLSIQNEIYRRYNQECAVYPVDLTNIESIKRVITEILKEHNELHGLINNAGVGIFDSIATMDFEEVMEMFQLNVFAGMQLVQEILPHFKNRKDNIHIVNIISQAAKISTPKSAGYAASKQAMLAFTNVLRQECKPLGINVMGVNLGPVKTNFFERADKDGTYEKNVEKYMLDPKKVAKKIVHHLFTNKREINLPWWMEAGSVTYRLIPGMMEKVLKKQFEQK